MEIKHADEYLEKIGWGKYSWKVFFQCGFVISNQAWSNDNLWNNNIAYILAGSRIEWELSGIESGILGSAYALGLLCGGFIFGIIGDKYGRMYSFKTTVLIALISSIVLTFSLNLYMSSGALFLIGLGMGGELCLAGTVFCEFCPRSKMHYLATLAIFWSVGSTFTAIVAYVIALENTTEISEWRIIVAVSCIYELISFVFRLFMLETPSFLLSIGRVEETESVLNTISLQNTGEPFYLDSSLKNKITDSLCSRDNIKPQSSTIALITKLFQGYNLKLCLIFCIMYISAGFPFVSILYFMPTLLGNISQNTAYGIIILQQACGIPGVLFGSWLVDTKLGRKFTITLSFALASLCCFFLYIGKNIILIIVVTSAMNMFVIMGYSAMFTITPESFPIEVRNIGSGFVNGCSRFVSIVCPIITGWLLDQDNGFPIAVILFAALFAVCAISAFPLKETRRSLVKVNLLST
ncbi:hypothetical protein SteCoe_1965 [Stentor coeruleus]|uniref:Major facilitator superfamily (MFS) profile domain-containing protein n=1 Tax=Stentor coeruleus TaxID=5963 RepID=A0A1R2D0L5_9CILI|nr:hypothetical protein SteCoe_1965 [Stentor coeruleus]